MLCSIKVFSFVKLNGFKKRRKMKKLWIRIFCLNNRLLFICFMIMQIKCRLLIITAI